MLLLHGFPQNWWAWNKVIPLLGEDFTLVAPDLRGIGLSDRPAGGYAKKQLAEDVHRLVQKLNCGPAHVVGHDIGTMVAYAYAWQFPARSLTVLDGTIPGIGAWDQIVSDPRAWHFAFHQKRDIPELLVCGGREYAYVSAFINDRAHNPGAFSSHDMDEFARAYSHPGAFRAAMEMYRQFPQDVLDNRAAGRLPSELCVLALGGDKRWGTQLGDWLRTVSDNVEGGTLTDCGHFLSMEQPTALADALLAFCR